MINYTKDICYKYKNNKNEDGKFTKFIDQYHEENKM